MLPETGELLAQTSYVPGGLETTARTGAPLDYRALERMLADRYEQRAEMQMEEMRAARPDARPPARPAPRPSGASPGTHGTSAAAQALQARLQPYFMSQINSGPGILGGYVETNKPGLNTVAGGYRMV